MSLKLNTDQNPITLPTASPTSEGLMSAADKTKLDGVSSAARVLVLVLGSDVPAPLAADVCIIGQAIQEYAPTPGTTSIRVAQGPVQNTVNGAEPASLPMLGQLALVNNGGGSTVGALVDGSYPIDDSVTYTFVLLVLNMFSSSFGGPLAPIAQAEWNFPIYVTEA